MNTTLLLLAVVIAALSGVPSLWPSRRGEAAQSIATAMLLLATALGAAAAIAVLGGGAGRSLHLPLNPLLPELTFGLDALSAVFLLPACLLCACAAVFDLGYWRANAGEGRRVRIFLGLLTASLMSVLAARDGVAFLIAWEAAALSAFFLITTEHRQREVRTAGWIYLAATHAGTLLLLAFFGYWAATSGGFAMTPLAPAAAGGAAGSVLFVLALAAFGLKAGIVPLHFWLPGAHANAPSHVSALLSGVLIKMGVYGVLRAAWMLPGPPVWWGVVVLAIGATSAVVGVAFAIGQHDLKRLLAYHSIENIGIIFLGTGLALLGRATGHAELLALGLGGALLHVWNHGLFKGLLFLAAGATTHACGTREIDRLGGVARTMPQTAACFLVGAVAICGLPPLNGFVSELLTYLGMFRALSDAPTIAGAAMVAIPALALVGAMALLCFVKVFGVVYLGVPRSAAATAEREAPLARRAPMLALAVACLGIGLLPMLALPALQPVIADWVPAGTNPPDLGALVPCSAISVLGLAMLAAGAILWSSLRSRCDRRQRAVGTWDCGYGRPTVAMQYTATSFAQQFVDHSRFLLLPVAHRPATDALFPGPARFDSHVPDLVLDRMLLPTLRGIAVSCNWLRALQRGKVQVYLLYVFLTLLCLLLFA
ncbi:MAG TPA: proton-conducting transporter membrane subunit [Planctomycetota bacterium]|nr:proton-conducting transporter membrane subunit [Planctomycetota bacterium]